MWSIMQIEEDVIPAKFIIHSKYFEVLNKLTLS